MHRVDVEALEEDKQLGSPIEVDTIFYECPQQMVQLPKTKMADIPEEPEDAYENLHPAIVPLKEAAEIRGRDEYGGKIKYATVHYSRIPSLDQARISKVPLDGTVDPKEGPSVIYTVLPKQP